MGVVNYKQTEQTNQARTNENVEFLHQN